MYANFNPRYLNILKNTLFIFFLRYFLFYVLME